MARNKRGSQKRSLKKKQAKKKARQEAKSRVQHVNVAPAKAPPFRPISTKPKPPKAPAYVPVLTPPVPWVPKTPRPPPRTTRATSSHNLARERLRDMEAALDKALAGPQTPEERAKTLKAKEQVEKHRIWISENSRTAVPVGFVKGSIPLGDYQQQGLNAKSYAEPRPFYTGSAFLAYMQYRPGVKGLLSIQPKSARALDGTWKPQGPPPAVRLAIANLAQVKGERDAKRKQSLIDSIEYVWEVCDAFGAVVTAEVDWDSGGGEE